MPCLVINSLEQSPCGVKLYTQLFKGFPAFYGNKGLFTVSQEPTSTPHPEPNAYKPHPKAYVPKSIVILILSSKPRSIKWSFPFMFQNQHSVGILDLPMRANPVHLITLKVFAEECKLCSP